MKQGLFESLIGHFSTNTAIDDIDPQARMQRSVMDHLQRLFDTREGSLPHLKNYGLPDISEIYRKMPNGIIELSTAIRQTIETYEPRLKNVKVVQKDNEGQKFKLVFIISGELRGGGRVRFQTTFTSTGNSTISPFRKAD